MPSDNKTTSTKTAGGNISAPLQENLPILNLGRISITTLILGSSLLISEHGKNILQIPSNTQIYVLISIIYFYSLVCLYLTKFFRKSQWFTFLQIMVDIIFITAFVNISGGVESIFIFLYFISVIISTLFLDRAKLLLVTLFATLLFNGIILGTAHIELMSRFNLSNYIWANRFIIYKLVIYTTALWGIAFLTSTLSIELQKRKTELYEKTREYKKLERFNENILQSIGSGILTFGDSGTITYMNKAGENILETKGAVAVGRNIQDIFPDLAEQLNKQKKPHRGLHQIRIPFKRSRSRNKVIGLSLSTLLDSDNQPAGKIAIFQDLTRLEAMEKRVRESEKLATVGRFTAALAHEIRNPMASLSGSIQVLKESLDLKGAEKELMDIVLRETDRLNRLISDFLQFSRFGKENLQRFKLHQLIEEIVFILTKENHEKEIRFINKIPKDLVIYSDRDKLQQIFWNILINAVQAKDKKELVVNINGDHPVEDEAEVPYHTFYTITIKDNGRGIPKAAIKKIFEPFFTTRPEGTGLGLSIAHQIMSSLGGNISVTSEEGTGTSIQINLPI